MFSWDANKATANHEKHGVSFAEASSAFDDPEGLQFDDLKHSDAEPRLLRLGRMLHVSPLKFGIRGEVVKSVARCGAPKEKDEAVRREYWCIPDRTLSRRLPRIRDRNRAIKECKL
ncbi:MAG: BrnT family toxin [bacterium]|nr:BrnT family toxin [bacterium]